MRSFFRAQKWWVTLPCSADLQSTSAAPFSWAPFQSTVPPTALLGRLSPVEGLASVSLRRMVGTDAAGVHQTREAFTR
jgi:hypothetical protein